ncbi:hypothetical protein YC2023_004415 [Brassica napus]
MQYENVDPIVCVDPLHVETLAHVHGQAEDLDYMEEEEELGSEAEDGNPDIEITNREEPSLKIGRLRRSNCSLEKRPTDRAQIPWKRAPEKVRAPSCPDPVAPRGAVDESGGKFRPRLNMGERPIENKYRESQRVLEIVRREADGGRRFVKVGCGKQQSGLPIDMGRGPTRIKVVT